MPYLQIVEMYISGSIVKLLWLAFIYLITIGLIRLQKRTYILEVPWSVNQVFLLLAVFIIIQYTSATLAAFFVEYVYSYSAENLYFLESFIPYITAAINSLSLLLITVFLIKKRYRFKIGFEKCNLQQGIKWGFSISLIYIYLLLLRLKGFHQFHYEQYAQQIHFSFNLLSVFSLAALVPIAEEIFFRGFVYRALKNRFSFIYAAIISSLCFLIFHMTINQNSWIIFLQGFLLAYVFFKSKSLIACIILHISGNLLRLIADYNQGAILEALSWNVLVVIGFFCVLFSLMLNSTLRVSAKRGHPSCNPKK